MAEQIYYSVFTKKGLELLTEAIRNGTKLGITSMAFGDGGGSLPIPNENFTSMVREVHRTQLNSLAPDPNNANWLRAEAIIASAVGGFNIRELGLYAGNVLVAYSNYPATYKPNPSDGTARIMTFRMILQIDNTANFDLVIDPDVVLATIQFVDTKFKQSTISLKIKELLKDIEKWDQRVVNVDNDGCYIYSLELDDWIKDEPFNLYDFKTEQPLQYYYNRYKDWDKAIHQAQLNMYNKGYSYTMLLPRGDIIIKKPIFGCAALGMYMHSLYPELKLYNEQTNTFKLNPPLVIKGHGRDSSKIIFAGGKGRSTPDDKTYLNYGAIHTAPYDVLGQCSGSATKFYHQNAWTRFKLEGFTLWGYNPETNADRPNAHGIVAFRGNRAFVNDVSVECFNGAGLLCDGFYDSFFRDFEIFQCGRMSPKYGEYFTKNLTDIKYQTYAPLHVMCSTIGDGWDNCNFLRFHGLHIEDCYNAVADIIVSGNSSPIWIDNAHIESENGEGISKLEKKALIAIGGYGVSRFAQDGVDNYNYGSEEFHGNGGGYVIWNGGGCYSWTYNLGILMNQYTQLTLNSFSIPNHVNVNIDAGNTSAKFEATNCVLGSVKNMGNATQISLTDCTIDSYEQMYGFCPKMSNTIINDFLVINENLSTAAKPLILNKVTCRKAEGIVNFGSVDLIITGTEASNLYVYSGTYNVFENYIQNNLGAV